MTYDRFLNYVTKNQIWIISNLIYKELISVQIPDLPQTIYYWSQVREILVLVSLMHHTKFEKKTQMPYW